VPTNLNDNVLSNPKSTLLDDRYLRIPCLISLLNWGLFACLLAAPAQIGLAEDPNQVGKNAVQSTRQDEAANERARRDAAGLLTIEGMVVDESGEPVSKARVRMHSYKNRVATSLSDLDGRFRFYVDLATSRYLTFVADYKNRTKGYKHILEEGTLALPEPLQIVLKPPRELVVEVKDANGGPVSGAVLEIASTMLHSIDEDRTGPDGTVRFRLPADAEIDTVTALKSGAGFDYWNRGNQDPAPQPLPKKLALTLNGARTVRVRAIDSLGQPVPGVDVAPWTVSKPGHTGYVNLSGFQSQFERAKTDAKGIATIDWLPRDFTNRIAFLASSADFHLPQPPVLEADPNGDVADLEMQLLRLTKISGTVLAADGKPAPGIVLQAEGRGASNHYFRNLARTNAEGAFEFRAYPEQSYLISVLDENWAAACCTVAQLTEDQPVDGLEFRLTRGTVLRGVATTTEGRVQAKATVTLVQFARLPAPANSPELVRWAATDSEGRYQFRIGPGSYNLYDPGHKAATLLKVDSEPEVVRDFRSDP
jgi:protocatechuate 3,4-dioxygenase beta subunit